MPVVPSSCWTRVFRQIVIQLKNNSDISSAFGARMRTWDGSDIDATPFVPGTGAPILRLTPQPKDVNWYSEGAQWGTLNIMVEIAVQSLNIDNLVDLYDLLVSALLPDGPSSVLGNPNFRMDLVQQGAENGEIVFAEPAFDPRPAKQPVFVFLAFGRMYIKVIRPN